MGAADDRSVLPRFGMRGRCGHAMRIQTSVNSRLAGWSCLAVALLATAPAFAKPIAFQGGTTVMAEYGAGTMIEGQIFYAPSYRWSTGLGHLRLEADDESFSREITYARVNLLVARRNRPQSQGNLFTWTGLGGADSSDVQRQQVALNAGGQADYETLRFYSSLRTDWHYSTANFSHRIDTAQLGWAPYPHNWDRLATWVVVQGRNFTGGLYDDIEGAVLLRFFRNGRSRAIWVEAGVTQDGRLQSMLMINF